MAMREADRLQLFEDYNRAAVKGALSKGGIRDASSRVARYRFDNLPGKWIDDVVQGLYPGFSEDGEFKPYAAVQVGEFLKKVSELEIVWEHVGRLNAALIKLAKKKQPSS